MSKYGNKRGSKYEGAKCEDCGEVFTRRVLRGGTKKQYCKLCATERNKESARCRYERLKKSNGG